MARIRSLHPGQWTDEAFVQCSAFARLLALGLRNEADDQGVFEWKPTTIKMRLFPADAVDVVALLAELEDSGQIRRFEVAGKSFGAIRNFRKWQRPEKANATHPLPDDLRPFVYLSATDPDQSPTAQRPPATVPRPQNTGVVENQADSSKDSATAPRPVADQSPNGSRALGDRSVKVTSEEGGRREEVGDTMKEKAKQRSSAREGFSVEADPALIVIEAFDQALVDAYGPERGRPNPAGDDIVFARRWLARGFQPQDLYQFFLARQRARAARNEAPINRLKYLEQAVAELGGGSPAPQPGAHAGTGVVRFMSPDAEIAARKAWWMRDFAAAKARGKPAPPLKDYGLWADANAGHEARLMGGDRPPIPPMEATG